MKAIWLHLRSILHSCLSQALRQKLDAQSRGLIKKHVMKGMGFARRRFVISSKESLDLREPERHDYSLHQLESTAYMDSGPRVLSCIYLAITTVSHSLYLRYANKKYWKGVKKNVHEPAVS
jgi:hypothetical protein